MIEKVKFRKNATKMKTNKKAIPNKLKCLPIVDVSLKKN